MSLNKTDSRKNVRWSLQITNIAQIHESIISQLALVEEKQGVVSKYSFFILNWYEYVLKVKKMNYYICIYILQET